MTRHRTTRARVSKRPTPDNIAADILIDRLYSDLVEVEALAITADEAVTALPPRPSGRYARTTARLYTLVGALAGRTTATLERGEELVAMHAAHRDAQNGKRRAGGKGSRRRP